MPEKDYKRKLVDYAKNNLKKGYTRESLKWAMINQGNSKLEVQAALERAEQELAQEAPPIRQPEPKIETIDTNITPDKKKGFFSRLFG